MGPKSLVHRIVLARLVREVPIAQLRHNTKPVYGAEGYGGRPIEFFPPYRFFLLHERSQEDEAREQFQEWYRYLFRKYSGVGKRDGGMRDGSLYRLVVAEHEREGMTLAREDPRFREDLVQKAIALRVDQRFDFLETIRDRGYEVRASDLVIGVNRSGNLIYLNGGHHRAAALKAIGKDTMPGVLVLSPRARTLLRKLRIA